MNDSIHVSPMLKLPPSEQGAGLHPSTVPASGHLTGRVQRVTELTSAERERMLVLLEDHFANVTRLQFERDLAEKEWVILLVDTTSGQLQGFSTLMRLQTVIDGQAVVAFFSGDTIIHPAYWAEIELPRLWGRHVFGLAEAVPEARVYWFLISSGYKTYRFLPVFFREFYPTYRCPTPSSSQRVLDTLAYLKFPTEYDPRQGVIHPAHAAPLHAGVAEVNLRRLKDPNVAFFVTANPGYLKGDELACLTELTRANLTAAGRRMLEF